MKPAVKVLVSGLILAGLSGCSDSGSDKAPSATENMSDAVIEPQPVTVQENKPETKTDDLKQTASEWKDKTGELIEKAVDVAKEKATETKLDSAELYEAAKTKAADVAQKVTDKSSDMYQAGKEKSAQMLDNMSEKLKKENTAE